MARTKSGIPWACQKVVVVVTLGRGALFNVRTCFLLHGLKRDARETVYVLDKEALQEHRIYVWRFSILCIHIGG